MATDGAGDTITRMATQVTAAHDERRLLGLDLQTVGPALLVLVLAGLMSVALPSIDSKTSYSDETHPGDVVRLAAGITLVPAASWDVATGSIVGRTRSAIGSTAATELVRGSLRFSVQVAPFEGTPSSLLTRIDEIDAKFHRARGRAADTSARYAVTTRQGVVGVAEDFVGVARDGSVVAFIFEPVAASAPSQPRQRIREGVEVVVSGPPDEMSRSRTDIVRMIRSIRVAQ
jgi:hypothetical protein